MVFRKLTVRKVLRYLLVKAGEAVARSGAGLYRSPIEVRTGKWYRDNGDATLRLDYDLGEDSVVFDLGGYHGNWARDIFCMYGCRIHVFEPVDEFVRVIKRVFKNNGRVTVHGFGLAGKDEKAVITLGREGSSTFMKGGEVQEITLVRASDFFAGNGITAIDLMKINIEGGEYDLLEHMIQSGFVVNIANIQVQFHDFVPGADTRMAKIQESLRKTHHLTYQYPFVWENWAVNRQ